MGLAMLQGRPKFRDDQKIRVFRRFWAADYSTHERARVNEGDEGFVYQAMENTAYVYFDKPDQAVMYLFKESDMPNLQFIKDNTHCASNANIMAYVTPALEN